MKMFLTLGVSTAILCGGCAIIPERVDVAYHPDPGVSRVQLTKPVDVMLTVSDLRHAESADWIADKKNGYGMRMASVMAQKPVADLVREAFIQEFNQRGIRVGTATQVVTVDITRLESIYQIRFFSIGAIGYADLAVQVRDSAGKIMFARNFSTSNDEQGSLAGTAGQARMSVEAAISKIVGEITSDPKFLSAVTATQLLMPTGV